MQITGNVICSAWKGFCDSGGEKQLALTILLFTEGHVELFLYWSLKKVYVADVLPQPKHTYLFFLMLLLFLLIPVSILYV